jgi:hypothetical protein
MSSLLNVLTSVKGSAFFLLVCYLISYNL